MSFFVRLGLFSICVLFSLGLYAYDDYSDVECRSDFSGVHLDYDGEKFKGAVSLNLKRIIERNCALEFSIRNMNLQKIVVLAKGKKRASSVTLQVGRNHSYPRYFSDDYHRVIFSRLPRNRRALMRLHFRGKVKVEKIYVQFNRRQRGGVIFDS